MLLLGVRVVYAGTWNATPMCSAFSVGPLAAFLLLVTAVFFSQTLTCADVNTTMHVCVIVSCVDRVVPTYEVSCCMMQLAVYTP